ncbi:hypothetical protein PPACK8108_LOCUS20847 [Phakopsora pachyrhizi]|uniref:Uncharacterized protein n=1 Tax=Phakopsora pachyrhizi TaxID=170000 RepID=A0AAV0BKY7_PHAPC|nr:hypothetical protein PPACK8108_LOCUS20847 [Phakopsora pachyrhizi]
MTNNQITENLTAVALSVTTDRRRLPYLDWWVSGLDGLVLLLLMQGDCNKGRLGRLTDGTAWRSISQSGSTTDYPSTDTTVESVMYHGNTCVRMNKNATPGAERLPAALFKEILCQERLAHYSHSTLAYKRGSKDKMEGTCSPQIALPLDYVYCPIPTKDFTCLYTKPGQALLHLVNECLVIKRVPLQDLNNLVISLPKPLKDPMALTNPYDKNQDFPDNRDGGYFDKGKMYANDVAVFFESESDLHAGLITLTAWINRWRTLQVGHSKCAILRFGIPQEQDRIDYWKQFADPSLLEVAPVGDQFILLDGPVYVQRSYVYLGITVDDSLGCGYDNECAYAYTLAKKVGQASGQFAGTLLDPSKGIFEKSMLLRTSILSRAVYGGEWLGFHLKRASWVQLELNKALWMIVGLPREEPFANFSIVAWELDIPLVSVLYASLRHRLFCKAPSLHTDSAQILSTSRGTKKHTWSSITKSHIAKVWSLSHNLSSRAPDERVHDWLISKALTERQSLYPFKPEEDWLPGIPCGTQGNGSENQIVQERFSLQAYYWATAFQPLRLTSAYLQGNGSFTKGFHKTALSLEGLHRGTLNLVKIRTGAFFGITGLYLDNLNQYGFVPMAKYLARVLPAYEQNARDWFQITE